MLSDVAGGHVRTRQSVTAFSACVVPDKTPQPLDPPDTPDFSVACILFKSEVVAPSDLQHRGAL